MSLDNISNFLLSKLVKPEIPSRSLCLKPTRIYLDGIPTSLYQCYCNIKCSSLHCSEKDTHIGFVKYRKKNLHFCKVKQKTANG